MSINQKDSWYLENREAFAASPLNSVFPLLRSGLWHTTSPNGWRGILAEGFIRPNKGERPFSYPQSETHYAAIKGCVALFDFENARESESISQFSNWSQFFMSSDAIRIAIQLDRNALAPKLIPYTIAKSEVGMWKAGIPYVECFYCGDINITNASRFLLIGPSDVFKSHFLSSVAEVETTLTNILGRSKL